MIYSGQTELGNAAKKARQCYLEDLQDLTSQLHRRFAAQANDEECKSFVNSSIENGPLARSG